MQTLEARLGDLEKQLSGIRTRQAQLLTEPVKDAPVRVCHHGFGLNRRVVHSSPSLTTQRVDVPALHSAVIPTASKAWPKPYHASYLERYVCARSKTFTDVQFAHRALHPDCTTAHNCMCSIRCLCAHGPSGCLVVWFSGCLCGVCWRRPSVSSASSRRGLQVLQWCNVQPSTGLQS